MAGQSQIVEWQFSTGLPTEDGYEIEKVPTLNRVWQGRIKMTNKVVAVAACCPRGVLGGGDGTICFSPDTNQCGTSIYYFSRLFFSN